MTTDIEMERGWLPGTFAAQSREAQATMLAHWRIRHSPAPEKAKPPAPPKARVRGR